MKKTNAYTRLSYRWKITLVILFFTCIPSLLFGGFYYKNVRPGWVQSSLASYYNAADNTALLLSGQFNALQSKMNYLANNSTIQTLINRIEHLSLPLALDMIDELENAVSAISADSPDLTVRWYPLRSTKSYGRFCYPLELFTNDFNFDSKGDHILYKEITDLSPGSTLWSFRDIARDTNNTGPIQRRLCLYTQIGNYNIPDCILELTIPITQYFDLEEAAPADSLFAFCIPKGSSEDVFLWDIVTEVPESDILLQQFCEETQISGYHVIRSSIPNIQNGEVIFAIPEDYVAYLIRPQQANFLMIAGLIAVLLFCISYITSRLLTRQYELNTLRMELEILQLRFNPHLLYNTLNALCFQVKKPAVRDTVGSLCRYYRLVLNNGYLLVSVKNELEMIQEYLKIECFAYALDQVQISFDVDEDILECHMVKHLLQPIVENALNHGIRPLNKGTLRICAKADGECILFEISDDGVGMSDSKASELLTPPKQDTGGYGIYNVQQRIHTFYGAQYGLKINSGTDIGTTVTLRLPKEPKGI